MNYRVLIADEALTDIFGLVQYIHAELCNPDIHKKVYESYLIFYIINSEKQEVYVLRVIKDLMNWGKILNRTKIYHFSSYDK